ncbi:protein of unknown function [Ruegeria intermedia]|uniref:Flavinylation-associated cytochrome domain-containing protein n=1 Tax=Ruegeria intermedia TaxID=996115 RepID=A0A1M4X2V4_9RHOB|nr:DUF4405 domain-containing protein [Ruegeria intermedia]SHE87522.1 protein of unknown function [Ruegeria intermedia]
MSNLRSWATPLTIGSFLIMGTTGSLMFFHLNSGFNKSIHEWAGWAMMIGVAAHLILNWRPFTVYFKRPAALAIIAGCAGLLALSFLPIGGGGNPMLAVFRAINDADAAVVIQLSGLDLETGLQRLEQAGFHAEPGTRISDLTDGDRGRQMQIVDALFTQ